MLRLAAVHLFTILLLLWDVDHLGVFLAHWTNSKHISTTIWRNASRGISLYLNLRCKMFESSSGRFVTTISRKNCTGHVGGESSSSVGSTMSSRPATDCSSGLSPFSIGEEDLAKFWCLGVFICTQIMSSRGFLFLKELILQNWDELGDSFTGCPKKR